jgi:hypothetical protein
MLIKFDSFLLLNFFWFYYELAAYWRVGSYGARSRPEVAGYVTNSVRRGGIMLSRLFPFLFTSFFRYSVKRNMDKSSNINTEITSLSRQTEEEKGKIAQDLNDQGLEIWKQKDPGPDFANANRLPESRTLGKFS